MGETLVQSTPGTSKSDIYINKDWLYKGEIRIMYCPTHLMLADYFAKPLQGSLLHNFRDIITERVITYTILKEIASYSSKKHVENKIPNKNIQYKIFH